MSQSLKEVLEWVIRKKSLSGEMYDLTASSFIGLKGFETGKIKNNYGLKDGISETLYKYKEELAIILKDETDDKFTKRTEIRDMIDNLLTCDETIGKMITEEKSRRAQKTEGTEGIFDKLTGWKTIDKNDPPSFDKLFKFITNYLNGGNGTSQFEKQPLIITVAGGNPLKIFFQILAYLNNKGNPLDIDIIDKFFRLLDTTKKDKLIKILTDLKNFLNFATLSYEQQKVRNAQIKSITDKELNTLATTLDFTAEVIKMNLDKKIDDILNFSDMDFAILPNEMSILDVIFPLIEEEQLGGVGRQSAKVSVPPPVRAKRDRGKSIIDQRKEEAAIERAKAEKREEELKQNREEKAKKRKQEEKKRKEAEKQEEKEAKEAKVTETQAKRIKKEAKEATPPSSSKSPAPPKGSTSLKAGPSQPPAKPKEEEKSHGFLLVRLKSANQFLAPYEGLTPTLKSILIEINRLSKLNPYPPNNKEGACANKSDLQKLGQSILFLAQPQLFRQSYLNVDGLSKHCKTFLQYKKEEKKLIGSLTSMNITTFVDYLSKNSDKNVERLGAFMDFLHVNGKLQNDKIATVSEKLKDAFFESLLKEEEDEKVIQFYTSKEDVIKNFESIEAICDTTKPLFEIMSELVLEFSQRPEVNAVMKIVTQKLNPDINPKDNKCFKSNTCRYDGVYIAKHLADKLNMNNKLHSINDAQGLYNLPDNSKISTNPTYKPTNLDSKRIKTKKELEEEEEEFLKELDNFVAAGIIDDELEKEIDDELIPKLSKMSIGEGRKKYKTIKKRKKKSKKKTIKKRNKKSKKKTIRKRKKKNKISRRKKYTKKNKKG